MHIYIPFPHPSWGRGVWLRGLFVPQISRKDSTVGLSLTRCVLKCKHLGSLIKFNVASVLKWGACKYTDCVVQSGWLASPEGQSGSLGNEGAEVMAVERWKHEGRGVTQTGEETSFQKPLGRCFCQTFPGRGEGKGPAGRWWSIEVAVKSAGVVEEPEGESENTWELLLDSWRAFGNPGLYLASRWARVTKLRFSLEHF